MKITLSQVLITTLFMAQPINSYAQEIKQNFKVDTIHYESDTTSHQKTDMPVAKPTDKNTVSPMPNKKPGQNEDGMPVKIFPDSTMHKHE